MFSKIRRVCTRRFRGLRKTTLWICAIAIILVIVGTISGLFSSGIGSKQVESAFGLPSSTSDPISERRNGPDETKDKRSGDLDSADKGTTPSQDLKCGIVCQADQKAFYVKTGIENMDGPVICYDGTVVVSDDLQNTHRGINAVFINGETKQVIEAKNFDTYSDEIPFLRYMKQNVPEKTVVIFASYDEISDKLKEQGRSYIRLLGSEVVDKIGFRDAFVLVGQLGLKIGSAIEFHLPRKKGENYADVIEKKGCFSFPLGNIMSNLETVPKVQSGSEIKYGSKLENCGLKTACSDIPVMIHTGNSDKEMPKICVNGYMVMEKDVNNAGRGFNIAVINSKTKKPDVVSRYDTYMSDSLNMELLLEGLEDGSIVVGVVNDDGSRKLSEHAKEVLNKLGSSMIQNLKFRDIWYFIGQKGIKGFTTMEEIAYAGFDGDWPEPLGKSFCVPSKVSGSQNPPKPKVVRNEARRSFCKRYDGYVDFCDASHMDGAIEGVKLTDESLKGNPIFDTPILVIPGIDNNAFARTLETINMMPGLRPEMVLIAYDETFPDYANLGNLFKFTNTSLPSSSSYEGQIMKAISKAWTIYKKAKHLIVIEEELILAQDFLSFMGQCLPIIEKDPTLFGISAWNYNGYDTTSGDRSAVYRVQEFPGLAFLLKKSVYDDYLKDSENCCSKRVWDNWFLGQDVEAEILVPDVSRAYRQPYQSFNSDDEYLIEHFHKPRLTNLEPDVKLENLEHLTKKEYNEFLSKKLDDSSLVPISELKSCWKTTNPQIKILNDEKPNAVIYYKEKKSSEGSHTEMLHMLCKCFGLFAAQGKSSRNLHEGLIRFYYRKKNVFIVESSSKFFSHKPDSWEVLTPEMVST